MKYIRTKDGIIFPTKAEEKDIDKSIYLKVYDTIEELCDEFVYIDEGCYPEISDELDLMQTKSTIIYGAIWTEWGLKYVARMNKEGKFELL